MPRTFRNPILPGFYPDPSVCRVADDYYLVNSSFEYFPGLPIFHSRDLVHWRPIGHVLDRPAQLNLDGARPSGGLYAPTIRYHAGTFYVINTLVDGVKEKGNFVVTATNPAGPWSEPHWLADAPGIDPSLFFDDDGRVWYVGTRQIEERRTYAGHSEVWLQELDLKQWKLIGKKISLWEGALTGAVWAEGPHVYKINGWYYLLTAEGGTGHQHAVSIARSRSIIGPYAGNPQNPILTHRHLGRRYPIVGTGHADLIDTPRGEWWMVALAMRPCGDLIGNDYFYNLGRETFLTPIAWEDDWPIVNPGRGVIEFESVAPDLPEQRWPTPPACDQFDAPLLGFCWNFLRTPREDFWSLTERSGHLRLRLRPQTISEWSNPSFVGRRQQHFHFAARTHMEFTPRQSHECAGLVVLQNNDFQYRCVVTLNEAGHCVTRLIQRQAGHETQLAEQPIEPGRVYLKVEAHEQDYRFYVANVPEQWQPLGATVDGRILSTTLAGGFVGAMLGLYASSNGHASDNVADFDWFEYAET